MVAREFFDIFSENWNHIEYEVLEEDDEKIVFRCNLTAEEYFSDEILVKVIGYEGGSLHAFLTFDQIDRTNRVYDLINNFNENNAWFRAYITNGDTEYLELHFANICAADGQEMAEILNYALGQLLSEGVLENLTPLTDLTY